MKKRWALAVSAATATVFTVGTASTAGAIPEHKAETWVCEGEEVTLVGTGRSGWIDGVHYLAVYIEFLGVFTPEGGGQPDFESEQKFFGNRGNLVDPEAIRCELHVEETIPGEGTFVGDGFVIAIPVS
jgi:hypothetical protein